MYIHGNVCMYEWILKQKNYYTLLIYIYHTQLTKKDMMLYFQNITQFSLVFAILLICINFWLYTFQCTGNDVILTKTASNNNKRQNETNNLCVLPLSTTLTMENIVLTQSQPEIPIAFSNVNFNLPRWDQQHLYRLHDFALVGDAFVEASANSMVCLATQSSVERLHSLAQVARQWAGPISIAVFVAGNEEFSILQNYVTYLRLCYDFIRQNVTFHIGVPSTNIIQQPKSNSNNFQGRFDCNLPEQMLKLLLRTRTLNTLRWRQRNEYPQNHLRNLARKGCQSKFVFLTDVDIIPSSNIVPLLNQFLQTININVSERIAYVIPTFEIDVRVKFPHTKVDLLRLIKKDLARPFHNKVFIFNQYATNFSRWLQNDAVEGEPTIHISHNVTNFEFLYEPFYVALDNTPVHDERFIGYGFTRNSQVYEMYIAGYSFQVLTPVFTCHWGLQYRRTRPAWREQQNNLNRKRFEIFKNELIARYNVKS